MIMIAIFSAAGFAAAFMALVAVAALMHLTTYRRAGFAIYFAIPILAMMAVAMLASGRDLSIPPELVGEFVPLRPAVVVWTTRVASLMLLLAAVERIASYCIARNRTSPRDVSAAAPMFLILSFLALWAGTVLSPSLMGAVPMVSHEYVYTALIGAALLVATANEAAIAVRTIRDATMVFMVAGIVAAVVQPAIALETAYGQGLIPGLPRLAGLSSHAVGLGMIALLGLLAVWVRPYSSLIMTLLAWFLGLAVLFLCQSKTGWLTFAVCAAVMIVVRNKDEALRWASRPRNVLGLVTMLAGIGAAIAITGSVVVLGDLANRLQAFLLTDEGAQLATMTGRDQIWEVALQEWARHPAFGYGPGMFDETYRTVIGMPFATHGHNQLIDTLARSGTVGAVVMVWYWIVLSVYAIRHTNASGGLTAALLLLLTMRAVSEVPFDLFSYGTESLPHFLLLVCIAGHERARSPARAVPTASRPPVRLPSHQVVQV